MATEKATGLVVRLVDFSESSLIVTLFTREFGQLTALAKGGRRPKGPFESALDLLSTCRVVFLRKSSDALHLLTEAKLERRFRAPPRGLSAYYAGYYVAELLRTLTHDMDPHPELFDLAQEYLLEIGQGREIPWQILRFEFNALRVLGHSPTLNVCAECGAPVGSPARVPFGVVEGGVLCAACRPGKRHVISLTARSIELMLKLATNEPVPVGGYPSRDYGELRGSMNSYLQHLVGHTWRLHSLLTPA